MRSGCRTRRSWARESGLAIPTEDGGVELSSPRSGCTSTATRSPPASICPPEKVRLRSAGSGGAFGAREDVSLQVHVCLLALKHGPAGADGLQPGGVLPTATCTAIRPGSGCATTPTADGRMVKLEARLLLDGGAYQLDRAPT